MAPPSLLLIRTIIMLKIGDTHACNNKRERYLAFPSKQRRSHHLSKEGGGHRFLLEGEVAILPF